MLARIPHVAIAIFSVTTAALGTAAVPASPITSPSHRGEAEIDAFLKRVETPQPPRTRSVRRHSRNESGEITGLRLDDLQLLPEDYPLIGTIASLEALDLSDSNVTGKDLKQLSELDKLADLTLTGAKIRSGLIHLASLKNLSILNLSRTDVNDQDLAHLKQFPALRHLTLNDTGITDAGLAHLAELKDLETLRLGDTNVTDAGLPFLLQTNLQGLTLNETKVSPEGMKQLAQMPQFAWTASPQATIDELVSRLEDGNQQGVLDMFIWGPYLPQRGELQIQKVERLLPTDSDIRKQRQRFRLEMRRISLLDNLHDRLFAVILVDRGTIAVAEIGLIER